MKRKLDQLLFPSFFIITFIIFPLFFSFDENSNELSYSNNVTQIDKNSSKKFEKVLLAKPFFFKFFNSDFKDEKEKFEVVVYNENRISIFSEAIESLMKYYCSPSFQQLQLPSVGIDDTQPKAYFAGRFNKPAFVLPDKDYDYDRNPPKDFFFANVDKYKQVIVPQMLISNGHTAVRKQFVGLPRLIMQEDLEVKFFSNDVEPMFLEQYSDYFKIDFKKQFGRDPETMNPKKVRKTLQKFWQRESKLNKKIYAKLRTDLLEKNSVIKLTGCKYSFQPDTVRIYYDLNTDLFGIVNEKNNRFIAGGIASLCDYIDIYYFKWLGEEKTFNQSIKLEVPLDLGQPSNPLSSLNQEYQLYDKGRDIDLPQNYDPEKWWYDTQEELVKLFLESINQSPAWYDNLKIGDDNKRDPTSEFEAFTMLQLDAEEYLTGVYRPDKVNNRREKALDTDARFQSFNPELIQFCQPTIVDIKALIDPESVAASQQPVRPLKQQVDDVVKSVKSQQIRSRTKYNETVLHVITLFRVRPIDRALVIATFKAKAIQNGIDLNCVLFLNTRGDSIY